MSCAVVAAVGEDVETLVVGVDLLGVQPRAGLSRRARRPRRARRRRGCPRPMRRYVRANSFCTSAARKPKALSTPGVVGMISGSAPMSRASALACSGPAPPKATSAEVARVVAALDADHAQGGVHVLVGDVDDRLRRCDRVDAEALGDLADRRSAASTSSASAPAELRARRAGARARRWRRSRSARRRRGRSRPGPGRRPRCCGPDLQRAGEVEVGDRAAARADAVDVGPAGLELVVAELRPRA